MLDPLLETRDLRLVLALSQTASATRAARLLHVSQSAVSHQLRSLEQRLGTLLFERRARALGITKAGERIVQLAREVLPPLLQVELELKRGLAAPRLTLRVATECYTAYYWLPSAIAALAASHPEVDLTLASEVTADIGAALQDDRIDLGLCVGPAARRRGFELEPLFCDELVLVVARAHRLAARAYVQGRDLACETLILNEVPKEQRERVQRAIFRGAEGFARVNRVPITEAILELVRAGQGVSILPEFTLRRHLAQGELATVRLTRKGLPRTWTGVFQRSSPLASPIRTLLDTLRAEAPPAQGASSRRLLAKRVLRVR
jgi:LysR family transcriptional regulator for metE and metH